MPVTPVDGRRVVAVMETVAKSAEGGHTELIKSDGGQGIAVCADVSDANAVTIMVEQTKNEFSGRIDALVNNAFPGFRGGMVGEANWKDFEVSWEIIVHGAFNEI